VTHYLAGLNLHGRRVVIVGGGAAVSRRIHRFLNAGAEVTIVAPQVQTALQGLAEAGALRWEQRPYRAGDLAGAWYAMAATDDPGVNAAVVAEADADQIFCVRADRGQAGSAVTPAVGGHDGLQVGVLAGGDHHRSGLVRDALLDALRSGVGPADKPAGTVALVGGGPGDPELITVRGARLLAQADVVVTDRLAPGELLERVRSDAELIDGSKLPHGRAMAQDAIAAILVERARAGRFVVRLKGGDPFVFGRGYEEVQVCAAAGVPTIVVPGVSSAIGGPGLAGIPLTHRGLVHEAVVVSGHVPPGDPQSLVDWSALGRLRGTIVILMGQRNAAAISAALIAGGRAGDTPVAVVYSASTPRQRRVDTDLAGFPAAVSAGETRVPAVIVVGAVTRLTPHDFAADEVDAASRIVRD
jgi:uroporphyrin-III C-methyltransferase/precorrin-2 dehydrogenase/sirohydrochlorin ferrochelatase